MELPLEVCGLWLGVGDDDHILIPSEVKGIHEWHVIAHEVGHMLMATPGAVIGHGITPETIAQVQAILFDLDPDHVSAHLRARSDYDDPVERDVELYATLAVSGTQFDVTEDGRLGRIRRALGGF
ncbi:hypothetical protein [Nonomuraea dietziae]|uniref:hypothetical protein n=1 Tax=Nonomuraea dietziae TaxID=65515 RepID=UPI0034030128